MDLLHFEGDENWLGSMVGGQLDGGRHVDNQGIQCGLYQDDEEDKYEIYDF